MAEVLKRVERFLAKHHVLSLATSGERLWCASIFFAYDEEAVAFIVASDPTTEHMNNVVKNIKVAGTVALETKMVGKIQGIQFAGAMEKCPGELKSRYFEAFPYARVMNPTLWIIRLDEVKMTDNTLGFGKKITWKRGL